MTEGRQTNSRTDSRGSPKIAGKRVAAQRAGNRGGRIRQELEYSLLHAIFG
jgi:hypothetical protein